MRGGLLAGVLALVVLFGTLAAAGAAEEDLHLPNLVPLPPFNITNGTVDGGGGPAVRFAFAPANRSEHPFDIMAEVSTGEFAPAYQCVKWLAPRVCEERREVGEIVWHQPHGHYHFEDYGRYELRRLDEDGTPDFDDEGLLVSSEKISFCLIDSDRDANYDAGPLYAAPFYLGCFVRAGSMGVSPGWVDIYSPSRPGQMLPLADVADGRYAIVAHLDPSGRLFDADPTDNMAYTVIDVRNRRAFEVAAP